MLRFFVKLKESLMPYLLRLAEEAHETGIPVMRPMHMVFPEDPACSYLDRQYMLGDELLVAPVFSESGEVEFYLPEGEWTDCLSGEKAAGGRWIRRTCDYFTLPLYRRGSLSSS